MDSITNLNDCTDKLEVLDMKDEIYKSDDKNDKINEGKEHLIINNIPLTEIIK